MEEFCLTVGVYLLLCLGEYVLMIDNRKLTDVLRDLKCLMMMMMIKNLQSRNFHELYTKFFPPLLFPSARLTDRYSCQTLHCIRGTASSC